MVRFRKNVVILRFSDEVLNRFLEKYKDLNSKKFMNKSKLVDYAIIKAFEPVSLDVLRCESDYRKFLEFLEGKC